MAHREQPRPSRRLLLIEAVAVIALVAVAVSSLLPARPAPTGVPPSGGAGSAGIGTLAWFGEGSSGGSVLQAPRTGLKVVLVVGPAGEPTGRYRAQAEAAAQVARAYSDDVLTLYSPNATWDAVRPALQDASIVVYLGHGNGWPSRYRDALYPPTQNGLGLNPVAGRDDTVHQYFGEEFLARDVRLAPGAVVLLHHLCYASGNTEPGLPEGSPDESRERVDNFAAGWLAAGAGAVVAEAWIGPEFYMRSLLAGNRSVESIWRASPNFNGHVEQFASARTPGAVAFVDPEEVESGFTRSLVVRGNAAPGLAGGPTVPAPALPAGIVVGEPQLVGTPVAGSTASIAVPVSVPPGAALPDDVRLGVRWDPIALDPEVAVEPGPEPEPGDPVDPDVSPTPLAAVEPTAEPGSPTDPDAPPAPEAVPAAPPLELVTPEQLGNVLEPVIATVDGESLTVPATLPARSGHYRLVVTLHDAEGVAFGPEVQDLLTPLRVHVVRPLSVAFGLPDALDTVVAADVTVPVRVMNPGRIVWSREISPEGDGPVPLQADRLEHARLVARLVPLGAADEGGVVLGATIIVPPGHAEVLELRFRAPERPGEYLLVLDVEVPGYGSLVAAGIEPGLMRVHVGPLPTGGQVTPTGVI